MPASTREEEQTKAHAKVIEDFNKPASVDAPGTKTITLHSGYSHRDPTSGEVKTFRDVTMRAPTMRDAITRDVSLARLMNSSDEHDQMIAQSATMGEIFMIVTCIVNWAGIANPNHEHVMDLTRADAFALQAAIVDLEAEAAGNDPKTYGSS